MQVLVLSQLFFRLMSSAYEALAVLLGSEEEMRNWELSVSPSFLELCDQYVSLCESPSFSGPSCLNDMAPDDILGDCDLFAEAADALFPDCLLEEVEAASGLAFETNEEVEGFVFPDCPERPGQECRSCKQHREMSGDPSILCSLCYMRLTACFVYSKYGFCNFYVGV